MRPSLLAAALLAAAPAGAAETAAFLDTGVGARALGLGGAYSALADDSSAVYWNPAGLASLKAPEAGASHAELGQSTHLDFLAYAHPTKLGTFAAAITYLSEPALEGRDALGRKTGDFNASDAAVAGAWGVRTPWADAGVSVKLVQSHIAASEARGAALDAGLKRELGPLSLAAAARNIGPGLKYERERNDLPLRLAAGAAYRLPGRHALAVELVNAPRGGGTDASLGGEARPAKGVALRAGYTTRNAVLGGSGFDAARGLTLGVGLDGGRWTLDYAVAPMGELGSAHRFSVAWRFAEVKP